MSSIYQRGGCRGHSFLSTNEELLDRYAACPTSAEVIQVQTQYLEQLANVPAKVPDGTAHLSLAQLLSEGFIDLLDRLGFCLRSTLLLCCGQAQMGCSSDGPHAAGDDYMSNMDLPPSSSDEEEAEEGSEDEAGSASDARAQPQHQTADAAQPHDLSTPRDSFQSQNAASDTSPISTAEERCSSSEAQHNVAQGHTSNGVLPGAQVQNNTSNTAGTQAQSLQTSLEHLQLM